jgi:opacity protein-like surface antigen
VKRNLIFWLGLILGLLVASPLAAQKPEAKRGAYLIVHGGLNLYRAKFYQADIFSQRWGAGPNWGIGLGIPIYQKWGVYFQSEFSYTTKGHRTLVQYWPGTLIGITFGGHYRYEYHEFPLLVRKNLNLSPRLSAYALAGPSLGGRVVNTDFRMEGYNFDQSQSSPRPEVVGVARRMAEDFFNSMLGGIAEKEPLCWNVGAGISYQLADRHQISIEGRYGRGTTRFLEYPDVKQRHRVLSVNFCYQINLGK